MGNRVLVVLSRIVALVFGFVWGFFVAFNAVFSDVFGAREMLGALLYVLGAYFGLGLVFGVGEPGTGPKWTWWLAPPGVLLSALMSADAPERVVYVFGVMASVVVATLGGSWAGSFARMRLGTTRDPSGPHQGSPSD